MLTGVTPDGLSGVIYNASGNYPAAMSLEDAASGLLLSMRLCHPSPAAVGEQGEPHDLNNTDGASGGIVGPGRPLLHAAQRANPFCAQVAVDRNAPSSAQAPRLRQKNSLA